MTPQEFQSWLVVHGAPGLAVDGALGPATRAAILAVFSNKEAPAATDSDMAAIASRLGGTVRQLKAVAAVESGGSGFDDEGRPKILFERHYFHRLTDGKWTPSIFSDPTSGGYSQSSWEKLTLAACRDVDAAFASASWGKFQVMGAHWKALGYDSPLALAWSCVGSEAAHYELLARYIEHNNLAGAFRAISADPETCRAFAAGYNGPGYRKFDYHSKIAARMK